MPSILISFEGQEGGSDSDVGKGSGRSIHGLNLVEALAACEDKLLKYGGHIGYGVAPKHRGHGYAAQMVKMVMPQLKKLGLEMVLLCCVSDNVASAKTIVNVGGVLENEVEIIRNNQPKIGQRYWLEVK